MAPAARNPTPTPDDEEPDEQAADEVPPPHSRGWFTRQFWLGVAASVVAGLIVAGILFVLPKFFSDPPDKRVGDPVTLGPFTYTVRSFECGAKEFGFSLAHGKFCVATLYVVNNSGEADSPFPSDWIVEAGEQKFDPAEWSGRGFARLFPGEGAEGQIAFDVPSESSPTALVIVEPALGFLGAEERVRVTL